MQCSCDRRAGAASPSLSRGLTAGPAAAPPPSRPAGPGTGGRPMTTALEQHAHGGRGAESFVRITTTRREVLPVYRDGWTSRILGRDRETHRWIWLVADIDRIDVVLLLGSPSAALAEALLDCGYR